MLALNNRVKKFLQENFGVDAKATDDAYRAAAGRALGTGEKGFNLSKYQELMKDEERTDEKNNDPLVSLIESMNGTLKTVSSRLDALEKNPSDSTEEPTGEKKTRTVTKSRFELMMAGSRLDQTTGDMVCVRGAHEQYSTTKSAAHFPSETQHGIRHPFAGERAYEGGAGSKRGLDQSSDLEMACSGAFVKFVLQQQLGEKCPRSMRMTEHESELMQFALAKSKWSGVIGGDCSSQEGAVKVNNRHLSHKEIKAVLDDSVSGGLELAPIYFDDAVILTPILYGEFAPRVNMVPISRGRRIEGGTISNVTLGASTEGVAITLFNTAGFIAAFDTTIFVVAGAIEIGLDYMSDSPIDLANIVIGQYGRVLLEWLDEQICVGDGTTEPEGIMNAAGTVDVDHSDVAPTVGGYESMLFGIAKKYKQGYDKSRIIFGGTETSYQRARAIAVGNGDSRRMFGLNEENYMLFGHVYGINESMANTQLFFGNLGRYRMYRRQGLTFRATTEGSELIRNNEMLLTCRARFGGQVEDANAFCTVDDAEA